MDFSKEPTYKRLDFVLSYLNSLPDRESALVYDIYMYVKSKGYETRGSSVKAIVRKLKKDKFIEKTKRSEFDENGLENIDNVYYITLEGESLLEIENGYTGRRKKERLNSLVLKWFTGAASLGTIGLLTFEILTYESPTKQQYLERQNMLISTEKGTVRRAIPPSNI